MELVTGDNKEQFKGWYFDNDMNIQIDLRSFYSLTFEMQKGVYEAYYDSLGMRTVISYCEPLETWTAFLFNPELKHPITGFNSRNEACKEALKKADELRNQEQ